MTSHIEKTKSEEAREREMVQYIAEMLLELRNMAKSANLTTLLGLLEITFYEAFSLANKVEIPEGEVARIKQLARAVTGR